MKAVNYTRSKTMSFKATPVEDLEIKRKAEQKNMSPSDFMHSLTMIYMDDFVLEGKSAREQEFRNRIEELEDLLGKEKFKIIGVEMEKSFLEDELKSQIKEKTFVQKEQVKAYEEIANLKKEIVTKGETIEEQQNKIDKSESKSEDSSWGLPFLDY